MESKLGSLLSLIAGILWLVTAIIFIVISLVSVIASYSSDSYSGIIFGSIFLGAGIYCIVLGALSIKAGQWMKKNESVKKGGITELIIGIIGSNIIAIIAGIISLIDSGK